jgi:hypothetical protein
MTSPPTASLVSAVEGKLSRRALLLGTSAVAVAAVLPVAPVVQAVAKPVAPPLPTWIVGTPGEGDHYVIRALTYEDAVRFRCEPCWYADDPDPEEGVGGPDCECCDCTSNRGYEATRVQAWDGRRKDSITGGDWVEAGFQADCSRCGYEATRDDNGRSIGGEAVCGDCMTLADWDIVDPEYAAELRAEQEPHIPVSSDTPNAEGDSASHPAPSEIEGGRP